MANKRRRKKNGTLSGAAGPDPSGKPRSPIKGTRAGASQRSGYASIVGKAPDSGPGDRATAANFLKKIELAIDQGGWKPGERTRLYRLRDKWKARAEGKDPRFNVAGTRAGRLDKSIEDAIEGAVKRRQKEKRETSRARDRRRRSFDWSAYEDLDAPFGFAKGGIDLEELEGNLGDDETGEAHRPRKRGERAFIVPGQDANGHSHRVQCRVMPAHYRALSIIYTSKKFPSAHWVTSCAGASTGGFANL